MGLRYLLAIKRWEIYSAWSPGQEASGVILWWSCIAWSCPEAIGTDLGILEASVRISCLDSGERFQDWRRRQEAY